MKTTFQPYTIDPQGWISPVNPANGKTFTLQEAQKMVGGYVQMIYLDGGNLLLCDEDGLSKGLMLNARASALTGNVHRIVGNVLVMPSHMFE